MKKEKLLNCKLLALKNKRFNSRVKRTAIIVIFTNKVIQHIIMESLNLPVFKNLGKVFILKPGKQ